LQAIELPDLVGPELQQAQVRELLYSLPHTITLTQSSRLILRVDCTGRQHCPDCILS
jgi:hypothetical protein